MRYAQKYISVWGGYGSPNPANGTSSDDEFFVYGGSNATLNGYSGNDSFTVLTESNYIYGGRGDDYIDVTGGKYNKVYGEDGDDRIEVANPYTTVDGGAGNDYLYVTTMREGTSGVDRVTLTGGSGNDTFELQSFYTNGFSLDPISVTITDIEDGDTIYFSYSDAPDIIDYTKDSSGNIVLQDESGSVKATLKGITDISQVSGVIYQNKGISTTLGDMFSVSNSSTSSPTTVDYEEEESFTNTNTNTNTGTTVSGNDDFSGLWGLFTNDGTTINGNSYTGAWYDYTGGTTNITDFESGDMINLPSNFTGISFDSSNFYVYTTTGTLTVKNIYDKVMNFGIYEMGFMDICLMKDATTFDGSGTDMAEIVYGSGSVNNSIIAGDGDSMLWGGGYSNDTLVGGAGEDTFIFGNYDGKDVVKNASYNDIVDMSSVSVFDLSSLYLSSGNTINLGTYSGSSLAIQNSGSSSAKIQLAEGSVRYNFNSGNWQFA